MIMATHDKATAAVQMVMMQKRLEEEEALAQIPQVEPIVEEEDISPEISEASDNEEVKHVDLSPRLRPFSSFQPGDLMDPDEDEQMRERVRKMLIEAHMPRKKQTQDDVLFNEEKAKGNEGDEVAWKSDEVDLRKNYEWEEKYRPRKPRYFNRVKTGFQWNKYNQTHYDYDNPPPKIVQGYKFNIFYPDLIDKTKPPTYHLEPDSTPETVIIRFHAGPPYEDIAFRILNREWLTSSRWGFRVTFERGTMALWFNLKRQSYRR